MMHNVEVIVRRIETLGVELPGSRPLGCLYISGQVTSGFTC